MLHQGIRVRDLPQDGKWKPVSEPDMMIVHVVTVKAEEAGAGRGGGRRRRRRRRPSPRSSRRARRTKEERVRRSG